MKKLIYFGLLIAVTLFLTGLRPPAGVDPSTGSIKITATADQSFSMAGVPVTHILDTGITFVNTTTIRAKIPGYDASAGAAEKCNVQAILVIDVSFGSTLYREFELYGGARFITSQTGGAYSTFPSEVTLAIVLGQTPFASNDSVYVVYLNCPGYYSTELVDATNLSAGGRYYPGDKGFSLAGISGWSVQGNTSGGVTTTFECSNDVDNTASADWIDVTRAVLNLADNSTGNTNFVDEDFVVHTENLTARKCRIKVVTSDGSNAVKYELMMQK